MAMALTAEMQLKAAWGGGYRRLLGGYSAVFLSGPPAAFLSAPSS
jgi:hypothetical protein